MSEPTGYGGLAHRNRSDPERDERTDRIRRSGSPQPQCVSAAWRSSNSSSAGARRCTGVKARLLHLRQQTSYASPLIFIALAVAMLSLW